MKKLKFLHMADLHIGSSAYIKLDLNAMAILHDAVEYANETFCNYIFICGDIFDYEPNRETVKRVSSILSNFNGRVFLIYGNHDFNTTKKITWSENVSILGTNGMENFFDEENNTRIWGYSYSEQQISEPIYNNYFNENALNNNEVNILLAHGGDKLHIPINFNDLEEKFSYVALGHIHKYTVKSKNSIYCGSLIPQDRTETDTHGYIYGEISDSGLFHKLIEVSSKYKSTSFDVTGIDNIEILYTKLREILDSSNMYNVVLTGKRNPELIIDVHHLLSIDNIEDIVDNTQLDIDYETLYTQNKNNILGIFIERMFKNTDELSKSALEKGVQAFLEEMNDN